MTGRLIIFCVPKGKGKEYDGGGGLQEESEIDEEEDEI